MCNVTIFGDSILKRVKLNEVTRVESNSNLTVPLQEERDRKDVYTGKRTYENTKRKWSSASQGEKTQEKPALLLVFDLGFPVSRAMTKEIYAL